MFSIHHLKNKIPIIFAPRPETSAVSILVLVKVGSRHENEAQSGISHFVEHLMFKGTARRPSTLIISQELDSIGADYNAFTGKEKTGYYIKAGKENLGIAADILADMITNSLFVKEEIERERGTILEEINMYEDNPMAKIDDYFEEDLFGQSTPLGRHIIGTPERIRNMKRRQIIDYWQKHYHANNMVIALAGNFKEPAALKMLDKHFGTIAKGKRQNRSYRTYKTYSPAAAGRGRGGARLVPHYKKTSQAHLVLGFPGVSFSSPERFPLGLLGVILGGNMSSRLFISVRERLGLCYFIRAGSDTYEDAGVFAIQAGLDRTKIKEALEAISRELKDVKEQGVKDEELEKAKQYLKGKMALSQEDSLELASFYGGQALFKKSLDTPDEIFKKIERVTVRDIQKVAANIISRKRAVMSVISPDKSISRFARFVDF